MVNKGGKFEQNSTNKLLMDTHKDGAFIFKSGFQPNIAHLFNSDFDNRGPFTEVMRYWPLKKGPVTISQNELCEFMPRYHKIL